MRQNNRNRPIPCIEQLLQILPGSFLVQRNHDMHRFTANTAHNILLVQIEGGMRPGPGIRLLNALLAKYERVFCLLRVRGEADQGDTLLHLYHV